MGENQTLGYERMLLARANRQIKELNLARMRGEMIETEGAKKHVEKIIGAFKAKILALPKRLAPLLISRSQINEIQALLEKEIHEALRELSTRDGLFGSGGNADGGPAPGPNRKRVGRPKKNVKLGGERGAGKVENGEG